MTTNQNKLRRRHSLASDSEGEPGVIRTLNGLGIKPFLVYFLLVSMLCFTVPGFAQKPKDSNTPPKIQKKPNGTTTTTVGDNKYGEGGTLTTESDEKLKLLSSIWKDKDGHNRELHMPGEERSEAWTFYWFDKKSGETYFKAKFTKFSDPNEDYKGQWSVKCEWSSDGNGYVLLSHFTEDEIYKRIDEIEKQFAKDGTITKIATDQKGEEKPKQVFDPSLKPPTLPSKEVFTKPNDDAPKETTTPSTKPETKPTPTPAPSNTIPTSTAPRYEIETLSNAGLYTVSLSTSQGTLRVNLTDDLAAGDTISGTVETEPAGRNETERARSQSELNGYVVELERQRTSVRDKWFTRRIPETLDLADRTIRFLQDGREVGRTDVPISEARPTPTAFTLPTGGQQGKPIEITGPFNGVFAAADYVKIGDTIVPALAESPRKRVVGDTSEAIGPTKIDCRENDKVTECPFRNLGIKLSAAKLSLLKGETTTLSVVVLGLRGLDQDVPLNLANHSPEIISLAGGNDQNLTIHSGDISNDGTYSIDRTLTGIRAGGFSITATVRWTNVCTQPKILATVGAAPPGKISLPRETIEKISSDPGNHRSSQEGTR